MRNLVIVGGGFAGVWAALAAARARQSYGAGSKLAVTLVSRDPWLTIRPRLYEDRLDDVRVPLDDVCEPAGVDRIVGEVTRIDPMAREVIVGEGISARTLPYDRLVLAAGSRTPRPRLPGGGGDLALMLDSYTDAIELQRRLDALPALPSADGRFTAVVVGAGFTGLEVATALASRLAAVASRAGSSAQPRVVIVERAATVAPDLHDDARRHVSQALAELGIETRVSASVQSVRADGAMLDNGEWIPAASVVWTGGLRAAELAGQLGVARDEIGRVTVNDHLHVVGVPAVLAAGDVARAIADAHGNHVAPMSCQCAIPMGEIAGHNGAAELLGAATHAFSQREYVTCLDLGEAGALFMSGWNRTVRLTGFWAKVMKQTINTRLIYPPVGHSVGVRSTAA